MASSFELYYQPAPLPKPETPLARHGCSWTLEEEKVLLNLFNSNTDPLTISSNMGRTVNGILAKLQHMRLIRWSLGYKAYFKTTSSIPTKLDYHAAHNQH